MKIVSKQELMTMPVGTPFAEYTGGFWPDGFDIFAGSTCSDVEDFYFRSIATAESEDMYEMIGRHEGMAAYGDSYPVDLTISREGMYDPNTRYLVWEPDDVRRIVNLLLGATKDDRD